MPPPSTELPRSSVRLMASEVLSKLPRYICLATEERLFVIIALIVLLGMGWGLAIFFGTELQKKFGFMGRFAKDTRAMVVYPYAGAERMGIPTGMRNVVLKSADRKPFRALIALKFELPIIGKVGSVDPYGFVRSDQGGVAVMSTYLGRGSADFVFIAIHDDGSAASISVSSTNDDQSLTPDVTYPPHWFQTFGPLS